MAEIWALRRALRTFEATLPGPEPIRPAVVAPLAAVSDTGSPMRKPPLIRHIANWEAIRRLVELGLKVKKSWAREPTTVGERYRLGILCSMSFLVEGFLDDHTLSVTAATAMARLEIADTM
jgi:hypothetical protein